MSVSFLKGQLSQQIQLQIIEVNVEAEQKQQHNYFEVVNFN
ncbi:unnamed protein product [Paramecium octaurelia]|uniref:Uncharacterized protein n=1 Tax=Paramecium octaurelia TaxID=43137 RepID=A0A8S1W3N3_PAROT|nr:unnamed protein product [Paramecium octaurelia]